MASDQLAAGVIGLSLQDRDLVFASFHRLLYGAGLVSLFASRSLMKAALVLAVKKGRVQGRRVVLVGLRDELANVDISPICLRRFGLTEVERIAFPNDEDWSLAANKDILASLDNALVLARDLRAEEIVLALRWNDSRGIELVRDRLRDLPLSC